MKKCLLFIPLMMGLLFFNAASSWPQGQKQIRHVVLVWLNQSGNKAVRQQFINNSKTLSSLPGVIERHVGVAMPSNSKIVDDSFDVAITVTLTDQAALAAYLNDPQHKKVVALNKPLLSKIIAYNIVSP